VNRRPPKQRRVRRTLQLPVWLNGHPALTYGLLILVLVIFLADAISGYRLMPHLWVLPNNSHTVDGTIDVAHQPWSLITSMFATNGIGSLVLGLFSIYSLGSLIERGLGWRALAFSYGAAGLAASLVAFLFDGQETTVFGAIMGIAVVAAVLRKQLRLNAVLLYITIAVNFFLGIYVGGWQAAIGGVLGGLGVGFVYYYAEDNPKRSRLFVVLLIVVGVIILAGAIVRAIVLAEPATPVPGTIVT
jgi:membrane associated rhomboid family serine protease